MSTKCDCGDQECAICCGRGGPKTFVDPYLAAKAEQERAAKQAHPAGTTFVNGGAQGVVAVHPAPPTVAPPVIVAPTGKVEPIVAPVVQVEAPPVAQLARGWTPPPIPIDPPNAVDQVNAGVDQEYNAAEAAIAELAGITPAAPPVPHTPKQQGAFARAYTLWQQECMQRNEWIAGLQKEWKSRIAQSQAAAAQWAAHVAEARNAWEQAKLTTPPPQPRKTDFPA